MKLECIFSVLLIIESIDPHIGWCAQRGSDMINMDFADESDLGSIPEDELRAPDIVVDVQNVHSLDRFGEQLARLQNTSDEILRTHPRFLDDVSNSLREQMARIRPLVGGTNELVNNLAISIDNFLQRLDRIKIEERRWFTRWNILILGIGLLSTGVIVYSVLYRLPNYLITHTNEIANAAQQAAQDSQTILRNTQISELNDRLIDVNNRNNNLLDQQRWYQWLIAGLMGMNVKNIFRWWR